MAKVFRPNRARLITLGYARLAHVPVLFDSKYRYCREYNWYLRDRATLNWHPSENAVVNRRIDFPSVTTLINVAYRLTNFIEWCEANGLDWASMTYDGILRYQDDQAEGRWSAAQRPLDAQTANPRADEATNYLRWAADRKLRPPFELRLVTSSRRSDTGRKVALLKVRAGRRKQCRSSHLMTALMLPRIPEVRKWLLAVRQTRGYAKYLACRFILEAGPRRKEVEAITADCWPSNAVLDELQLRDMPLAPVRLLETKGGRPRTIQVPLAFAQEVRDWIDGRRLQFAVAFYKRSGRRTDRLFLSDRRNFEGIPLSAQTIYDCFHEVAPKPARWSPHFGRHTHACLFLLQMLEAEAKVLNANTASECSKGSRLGTMGPDWINSRGNYWMNILRRQLGHVSEETTETYLRWLVTATQTATLASGWHTYLSCDDHDQTS
jgi:integrase